MDSKSFNALQAAFPAGSASIPGNPSSEDQTRLLYVRSYSAFERAKPSSDFPANHPCTYAFRKTDAP